MPLTKLTQKKAEKIRNLKNKHPRIFQKEIGRRFNITRKTVYEVLNNLRWANSCIVCGKHEKLTDGQYKGHWVKMCQKCYLNTVK